MTIEIVVLVIQMQLADGRVWNDRYRYEHQYAYSKCLMYRREIEKRQDYVWADNRCIFQES